MNKSYSVIYEAVPDGGFVAYVPGLPGCHTQGDTMEETVNNIKEAILVYLESLSAHNDPIPHDQVVFQGTVEVAI